MPVPLTPPVASGDAVRVRVIATNNAGLRSSVESETVVVDTSPPETPSSLSLCSEGSEEAALSSGVMARWW